MDCLAAGTCFLPNMEKIRSRHRSTPAPAPPPTPPSESAASFRFIHPQPRAPPLPAPPLPPRPSGPRLVIPENLPKIVDAGTSEDRSSPAPGLDPVSGCQPNPCANGGSCEKLEIAEDDYLDYIENGDEIVKFICICPPGWTGERCEVQDFCYHKPCKRGVCKNEKAGYQCRCDPGIVGRDCDRECPSDLCENGGTCYLNAFEQFDCYCRPGTAGQNCEFDIDECESNPSQNGGTCSDGDNDYICTCPTGYMGKSCHRACQDIYHSCTVWEKQNQCEIMRPRTDFFDVNCAVSCGQCDFDNSTVVTDTPLPPVLEPFEFLLGVWETNATGPVRVPKDFQWPKQTSYTETLSFRVAKVPMFGTPALNYSAIAVNKLDKGDVQITRGFLTIRPKPKDRLRAALMTVGNNGIVTVEEGPVNTLTVQLIPSYFQGHAAIQHLLPEKYERSYVLNGRYLQENIRKTYQDGSTVEFSKYFAKKEEFKFL